MSRHDEREGVKMTDEQIAEGLRLAGEATPGPWRTSMTGYSVKSQHDYPVDIVTHVPGGATARPNVLEAWLPNAAFIAHAGTHYAAALRDLQEAKRLATEVAEQQKQLNALYATLECGHQQQYAVAGQCLLCQVAEQQQEIERLKEEAKTLCARSMKDREEANAATMAARHAADALLWITPEHVSELQSKLRAVEALRDSLMEYARDERLITHPNRLQFVACEARAHEADTLAAKLTAILTPQEGGKEKP